ncbi:MAG: hypothetical protein JWM14_2268 [Chitinophagaceae bacterium]|nr:hypothetical protein [Chitinophagaceae bacterium]
MKAIEILYNLSPYQNLLDELCEKARKENADLVWTKSIKSQYSFITLELQKAFRDEEEEERGELAIQITFQIEGNKVVLTNVYCEEESKKEELEKQIKANKAIHDVHWHKEPNNTWYHDEVITAYLNVADEIASVVHYCASGDDYYPGVFSEIKVSETDIVLLQTNWHNAKSSAHKDNYLMRKLRFQIPLTTTNESKNRELEDNYQIGNMLIAFSDRSSAQNKECGKKIVEQILQQQAGFQNKK